MRYLLLICVMLFGSVDGWAQSSMSPRGPSGNFNLADATTNAVSDMFVLTHTGGTVAAGFGTGISFVLEDAGGSEEQASIDVVFTDVTDDTEDIDVIYKVNSGGGMLEVLRMIGWEGKVYVGVGGVSPQAALEVKSQGTSTGGIRLQKDDSSDLLFEMGQGASDQGTMDVYDGSGNKTVVIDGVTGAIGIGKADATDPLGVYNSVTGNDSDVVVDASGGVVAGDPTGGSKGSGTVNAKAVYDDNTILTGDYVFEDDYIEGMNSIHGMESFYKENKHLPTLTSKAGLIKMENMSLGQRLNEAIVTIENLAIYIVDLQKQIDELKLEKQRGIR